MTSSPDSFKSACSGSAFRLLDLPTEILTFHLIKLLDPEDIINLFLTNKELYQTLNDPIVWHALYMKSFGDLPTTEYSYDAFSKWGPNLYRMRKTSRLVTFGANVFGRLGRFFRSADRSYYERIGFTRRMYRPVEVDGVGSVADISAGGFSFEVLNMAGDLFYTGHNWHGGPSCGPPGPEQMDSGLPLTRDSLAKTQVRTGAPEGTKFVSVSSGRGHFIALDTTGQLWTWDCSIQHSLGIPLSLKLGDNVLSRRILKIRAGWTLSSALIDGVGIVVWNKRQSVHNWTDTELPAQPCYTQASVIPNTRPDQIVDYVVLEKRIFYISRSKGHLYRVELEDVPVGEELEISNRTTPATNFNARLQGGKFIRISGCYNRFTAMTNTDDVLIGEAVRDYYTPRTVPEIQHKSFVSVVAGDYHFLALNKEGELYSWGREAKCNGCLGLGKLGDIIESGTGYLSGADLVVAKPTRVHMDGKVLAIAAAGWQSAAIVGNSSFS